jgi:hypothetical protein
MVGPDLFAAQFDDFQALDGGGALLPNCLPLAARQCAEKVVEG